MPHNDVIEHLNAQLDAGADAVLIQSQQREFDQIDQFLTKWHGCHPIVIVPTTYYKTPTERFRSLNVNTVIWANHTLRAAIQAMKETTRKIFSEQQVISVENNIASIETVFQLQEINELIEAEKKYLPKRKVGK